MARGADGLGQLLPCGLRFALGKVVVDVLLCGPDDAQVGVVEVYPVANAVGDVYAYGHRPGVVELVEGRVGGEPFGVYGVHLYRVFVDENLESAQVAVVVDVVVLVLVFCRAHFQAEHVLARRHVFHHLVQSSLLKYVLAVNLSLHPDGCERGRDVALRPPSAPRLPSVGPANVGHILAQAYRSLVEVGALHVSGDVHRVLVEEQRHAFVEESQHSVVAVEVVLLYIQPQVADEPFQYVVAVGQQRVAQVAVEALDDGVGLAVVYGLVGGQHLEVVERRAHVRAVEVEHHVAVFGRGERVFNLGPVEPVAFGCGYGLLRRGRTVGVEENVLVVFHPAAARCRGGHLFAGRHAVGDVVRAALFHFDLLHQRAARPGAVVFLVGHQAGASVGPQVVYIERVGVERRLAVGGPVLRALPEVAVLQHVYAVCNLEAPVFRIYEVAGVLCVRAHCAGQHGQCK